MRTLVLALILSAGCAELTAPGPEGAPSVIETAAEEGFKAATERYKEGLPIKEILIGAGVVAVAAGAGVYANRRRKRKA